MDIILLSNIIIILYYCTISYHLNHSDKFSLASCGILKSNFYQNTARGLDGSLGWTKLYINESAFNNNLQEGIYVYSPSPLILENSQTNYNLNDGVYATNWNTGGVDIKNHVSNYNKKNGIRGENSSGSNLNFKVKTSTTSHNTMVGITGDALMYSSTVEVSGNTISNNTQVSELNCRFRIFIWVYI